MRKTVVGAIAVVAATSVVTLTGLGSAAAATLPVPAGSSAVTSAVAEAVTLQNLQTELTKQFRADDIAGMRATQAAIATELARLTLPAGHTAMAPGVVSTIEQARVANDELGRTLAHGGTRAMTPADLPSTPLTNVITSVLNLVNSLVMGILNGLLGSSGSGSATSTAGTGTAAAAVLSAH